MPKEPYAIVSDIRSQFRWLHYRNLIQIDRAEGDESAVLLAPPLHAMF